MRLFKKILLTVLSALFLLSLSSAAFADPPDGGDPPHHPVRPGQG